VADCGSSEGVIYHGRLCDVSVTGAWGKIDDSVTAGGLGEVLVACSRT